MKPINGFSIVILALLLACTSACNRSGQASVSNSASAGSATSLAPEKVGKFVRVRTVSGSKASGTRYEYNYADGRYKKLHTDIHGDDDRTTDIHLIVTSYGSDSEAQAALKAATSKAVPAEEAAKIKLPKCDPKKGKEDSDNFRGPDEIVKRIPNPKGGEVLVIHSGKFNFADCTPASNNEENVYWVDGTNLYRIEAPNVSKYSDAEGKATSATGFGRGEEFLSDYLQASGQQ